MNLANQGNMKMREAKIMSILSALCLLAGCSTGPNLQEQNAQLMTQNADLTSQLDNCSQGQTTLQSVLAQCEGTQVGLQAKLSQCTEYNQGLQSRCDQAAAVIVQANTRIRDLTNEASAASQAAADAQNRYNEAARTAQALKSVADQNGEALNQANHQLAATRATLQKTISESTAARDLANRQIAELSRQIAALQGRARQSAVPQAQQPAGRVATARDRR